MILAHETDEVQASQHTITDVVKSTGVESSAPPLAPSFEINSQTAIAAGVIIALLLVVIFATSRKPTTPAGTSPDPNNPTKK